MPCSVLQRLKGGIMDEAGAGRYLSACVHINAFSLKAQDDELH